MTTRRTALQGIAAGALTVAGAPVFGQDNSPTTVLVGAASLMDFTARLIAEQLRESLNRPAVVVSKLGAGQRVALGEAKRAAPDGRTLVFATSGPFTIYPQVYNKLDYDPVGDFTPIVGIGSFDVAIAAGPQSGATTLKEMMEWQRKRPAGSAVFGSAPGNGSLSHFLGINVSMATDVPMTHVAYKDSGVGIVDLAAGRLPMLITGLSPLVEMHKAGKIRILAVSGDKRSPLVPEVPTAREAGVNVSTSTTTAVFGPAGMSPEQVRRLHDAIAPMLDKPDVREKLAGQGMTPWKAGPQEVAASHAAERKHFEQLAKASGFVRQDA
ncbi:tripartite tricarboxylate transporter substrate-binding protein [Ramlibacter sp. AN1015]|uniref:Bug family tripartite tricarboxylate transporter substrate binding protein n=1 Tax=Ramlibacter sp. AN1015 TaxID=3133428 RepID=UPI0030BA851D